MEDFLEAGLPEDAVVVDIDVDYDNELGRGSDAAVYRGLLKSPVAVKVLHPNLLQDTGPGRQHFLARFGKECTRLRSLTHPNVVRFMGVCRAKNNSPALVTELMGLTLEKYYKTRELSQREEVDYFCDIAAGLAYVHSRGVVHRDLTTRNVLLSRGTPRKAKLADVGVSKTLYGDNVLSAADRRSGLTQCPGTINYMPPEALSDSPSYDKTLDSFSFGVLMMAVIVRREPSARLLMSPRSLVHADGSTQAIAEVERRADDFNDIADDHPARSLIARCLHDDPTQRPSASELCVELQRIRGVMGYLSSSPRHEYIHCFDCSSKEEKIQQAHKENDKLVAELDRLTLDRDSVLARNHSILAERDQLLAKQEALFSKNKALLSELQLLKNKRGTTISVEDNASEQRTCFFAELLEKKSFEVELLHSRHFLEHARHHDAGVNSSGAARIKAVFGPKTHFTKWSPLDVDFPDDVDNACHSCVHIDQLFVVSHSTSQGCLIKRTRDRLTWLDVAAPPDANLCHGLLSHQGHLYLLASLQEKVDPDHHLVLFKLASPELEDTGQPWLQLPNSRLPHSVWDGAFFAIGLSLLLAGGHDGLDLSPLVSEYSLENHCWVEQSAWPILPKALAAIQVLTVADDLYLLGGVGATNIPNTSVFHITTLNSHPLGLWTNIIETPYGHCGAHRVNGSLVVGGGKSYSDGKRQGGVFVLDRNQKWLQLPPLSRARSRPSLVFFGGCLIALGGGVDMDSSAQWCSLAEELVIPTGC